MGYKLNHRQVGDCGAVPLGVLGVGPGDCVPRGRGKAVNFVPSEKLTPLNEVTSQIN